jgi:DNA-binding transcriptional ArsR family regulator
VNSKPSDGISNSELAVKVLCELAAEEEGDYGSNLAKKLDKSQASVARILRRLHEAGMVEKGKREKAQYYRIDYGGVAAFWYDTVIQKVSEGPETIDKGWWLEGGQVSTSTLLERLESREEEIKQVSASYIKNVLQNEADEIGDVTVAELLFEYFGYAIGHNLIQNRQLAAKNQHLEPMKDALVYFWNLHGFAPELEQILRSEN